MVVRVADRCRESCAEEVVVAVDHREVFEAESKRLEKEIEATNEKIDNITRKLENKGFLAKAPENVVLLNKRRLTEETAHKKILGAALSRIKDAD